MSSKVKTYGLTFLAGVLIGALLLFFAQRQIQAHTEPPTVQVDTCITKTEKVDYAPKEAAKTTTGIITIPRYIFLPVKVDSVVTRIDTVYVEIEVDREQKTYKSEDYELAVSGYEPQLDWIKVFQTTTEITKTITKPTPKWNFGVQAGVGGMYTFDGLVKGGVYLGFGVTYRF